jgi:hypothetical protein
MAQQIVREEAHRWAPMLPEEVERMVSDELDRRVPEVKDLAAFLHPATTAGADLLAAPSWQPRP